MRVHEKSRPVAGRRISRALWAVTVFAVGAVLLPAHGVEQSTEPVETTSENPAAPRIVHYPKFTVVRGTPFDLEANIEATAGSVITGQLVQVKVTDLGYPTEYEMEPAEDEDDTFAGVIPLTFIEGVSVFWYSITAYDREGRVNSTVWVRVVVIEPAAKEVAVEGGAGAGGGSGGGDPEGAAAVLGGSGSAKNTGVIIGGALLAGGAALIIDNQDDKKKEPRQLPERNTESGGGGGGSDPQASPPSGNGTDTNAPACITTGSETVQYFDESYWCEFKDPQPTRILVCGTCPDATIMAVGSWGAMDSIANYNNDSCSTDGPYLVLQDPLLVGFSRINARQSRAADATGGGNVGIGTETITVYANGVQIDQIPWPPADDSKCIF